jgi:outer membrane receptor protein involved in Fe transport
MQKSQAVTHQNNNPRSHALLAFLLALLALSCAAARAADLETRHRFSIPPQALDTALLQFSDQAKIQVLMWSGIRRDARSPGVTGELTASAALKKILGDTGLTFKEIDQRTVAITQPTAHLDSDSLARLRLAQIDPPNANAAPSTESGESAVSPRLADIDEIVVTGTRLRHTVSTSPVITYDRQAIEDGGYTTIQDLMSRVPQNFNSTTGATGTGGGNFGLTTQIDLRGLGPQSTLTLVNGRRVAAGAGNQGRSFDISMIPVAAIASVDILTDGASALYGSDAIGGVVNLKLRRDFNGAESTVQYGMGTEDRDNLLVSQLVGKSWSSGYVLAAAQFDRRDAVTFAATGITSLDFTARGGGDYRTPGFGSPGMVFPLGPAFATVTGPGGTPVRFARLPAGDGRNVQLSQLGLNQMAIFDSLSRDVIPSQENRSAYFTAEQKLAAVTFFVDGIYAKREGEQQLAAPFTRVVVPVTNAFTPFSEPVMVGYVFNELGRTRVVPDSKGWFANLGARGDLGFGDWTWELVASRSRDEFATSFTGVNPQQLALRVASSDPTFAFNPFGDGSAQAPGVADALLAVSSYSGTSRLQGYSAQTEGRVLTLPSGEVRLVVGAEYHDEELDTRAGGTGRPTQILFPNASRNTRSFYAEASVPLVNPDSARSGMNELALSLAGRYDDYNDFGNATNPKVGLLWKPAQSVAFKANWGTSFRAPALRELYFQTSTFANFAVVDPHAPGGPGSVLVNYISGGNPTLRPEEAETYTFGVDYRPGWLRGAHFNAGYFHIDYDNRIRGAADGTTPEFLLSIESRLPSGIIIRDGSGTLQSLNLININSASTLMSGWDLDVGYAWSTDRRGSFEANATATVLSAYEDQIIRGAPALDRKGKVGSPADWRGRLGLGWKLGIWNANVGINYVDSLFNDSLDSRVALRDVSSQTTVDLQTGVIFSNTGSAMLNGSSVRLGVTNLFDRKPPFVDTSGGFDVRNHVYEGRFVYLRLNKTFGDER